MYRLGLALVALLAVSCGETTNNPASQQTFHRPIDIAFACYGGLRPLNGQPATPDIVPIVSAQPIEACQIRSGALVDGKVPVPPGQEDLTAEGGAPIPGAVWVGFVLQSAPGTVVITQFGTEPSLSVDGAPSIADADPLTPGRNGISVGEDPIAIATDKVGCYEVIANAGSCDLSILEINSALDYLFDSDVRVERLPITNAAGEEMLARPAAMVADAPGGVIGDTCPATSTGIVYVAYPACHLVAAVDTSTGEIVAGIDYSSGTATLTDGNVSCPAECGDSGATFTAGIRPITLDLERDPRNGATRLLVGADNSATLTLAEIGADGRPTSVRPILLEDTLGNGEFGVTHVAIGPQIGTGGDNGSIDDDIAVGGQFQFVYAIAKDQSIRVADILGGDRECDTNVDPRLIHGVRNVRDLSCFPVGAPTTPARRPNARGPGIRLPGPIHDVIPTSLDIVKAAIPGIDMRLPSQETLVGYYVVASASNGATYIIDVDDDSAPDFSLNSDLVNMPNPLPLAISHHVRDAIENRRLTNRAEIFEDNIPTGRADVFCDYAGPDPDDPAGPAGGARATNNPSRSVAAGVFAPEKVPLMPFIRQVLCEGRNAGEATTRAVSELSFPAPDEVRELAYPDVIALRDETWTITYEGLLSLDTAETDVDGPAIRTGQISVTADRGMVMEDTAGQYCAAGAEQFDIVQLRGCDPAQGDAQCPLGYTCFVHPNSQVAGLGACMLADEADRLADACKDFLTSSRRYTIGRAQSGELRLQPRRRQLRQTPLDGCVDDAQCELLADYAAELATSAHPVDDTSQAQRRYTCIADPDREPLDGPGQTGKRCIEACDDSTPCSVGGICRGGVCYEGVIPPQSCVNAPQRFELRAHDAFTVVGTESGYVHSTIEEQGTERCIRDPNAHPFEIGRVPLRAPPCDPTADVRTGRRPDGTFEPNPCSLTIDHEENVPNYVPGTCTLADPAQVRVNRQAPAIRLRTRGFTTHIVDPTYPGDAMCIGDRMGGLGDIPHVFGNYQLQFRTAGGLTPFTLSGVAPAFPVKVVRGPMDSIWVIDQGDFISTSLTQSSTRGRVYKIEAVNLGQVGTME